MASLKDSCREVMDLAMEEQELSQEASGFLRRLLGIAQHNPRCSELIVSTGDPVKLSQTDTEHNR